MDDFNNLIDTLIDIKDKDAKVLQIREIVPIEEWINSTYYVGEDAKSLYPYWKQHIINIFNSPVRINEVILTGYGQLKEMIDNCPYFQEHFPRNNKKDSEIVWPQANMMVRFASNTSHTIGTNLIG